MFWLGEAPEGGNPSPPGSSIQPATASASRYCIGCYRHRYSKASASAENGISDDRGSFPKRVEMLYQQVETFYEDCELTVIHKPAGLLSVPGKGAAPTIGLCADAKEISRGYRSAHRSPAGHGDQRTDDHRQDRICLSSPTEGVSEPSGCRRNTSPSFQKKRFRERRFQERHSGKGDSRKGNHLPSAACPII